MSVKKGMLYVFFANIINLVINLLTTFLLPKYLSIETYANIKLFKLYITYLGILHLGFADGMYLRVGGQSLNSMNKKEVLEEFNTFKIFQLFINVIMIIISIILRNKILLFCSLIIMPINVSNYIRNLYNAIGEFRKYSFYTNINTLMIFIINVILLFIIKTDASHYYIISYIVIYFIYWLFIELEIKKIFGKSESIASFDKKYLIDDIKSGCFLMLGNFCNTIFTSIDRMFVQKLIGLIEFAYYSFAASIENLLNVFITPISTTMYNYFCMKKSKDQVIKVKEIMLLFSSIIIILIFPAKFVVERWITKYINAIDVLFFLIAAQYSAVMIKVVHVNIYKANKQQNRYFKIMLCIIGISIILNILLYIIFKNMISIAIATLITNIIWFIIGEYDLKDFHIKIKDYVFFILNMLIFILCGIIFNSIVGCLIYLIFLIINVILFEKEIIKSTYESAKIFINKKIGKRVV